MLWIEQDKDPLSCTIDKEWRFAAIFVSGPVNITADEYKACRELGAYKHFATNPLALQAMSRP